MKKQIFEIKPKVMSYDNNILQIETNNHIFEIKDKRTICILADRLSVMKAQINNSKPSDNSSSKKDCFNISCNFFEDNKCMAPYDSNYDECKDKKRSPS